MKLLITDIVGNKPDSDEDVITLIKYIISKNHKIKILDFNNINNYEFKKSMKRVLHLLGYLNNNRFNIELINFWNKYDEY